MRALLAAVALAAVPISYEWLIAVVVPFIADVLWQSAEAISYGQLLGLALVLGVVVPVVSLVGWIARRLT